MGQVLSGRRYGECFNDEPGGCNEGVMGGANIFWQGRGK